MKLALIVPKANLVSENSSYASFWDDLLEVQARKRLWRCPTNGLLTVAALAQDSFSEITYIDENYEAINFGVHYDVIGLSFVAHQAYRAYEIAKKYREMGTKVIMGGIHPTLMYDEVSKYADSVFIGEAEPVWKEFVTDLKRGKLKNKYSNENPESFDLKFSPTPRFDLVNMDYYKMLSISISKGCSHDCEFCASSKLYGYIYRHKLIDQVINEVEIAKKYKKESTIIYFPDDNLISERQFAKELFGAMNSSGIRWYGHSDISLGNDESMCQHLYKSGCRQLLIGFESLSKDGLRCLDKNNWKLRQLPNYKKYVEVIQNSGIGIIGSFMIGLDGDNLDEFKRIRDFVVENHIYATNITVQTPFPNTRLYKRLEREGRIFDENWNKYTGFEITYTPLNMTVKELEQYYVWLYKEINSESVINKKLVHFKNINRKILNRVTN